MFEFLRDEEKIGEGIAIGEARGIAIGKARGEARTRDSIMKLLISRGMSSSEAAKIVNLPFENN